MEISQIPDKESQTVITHLKSIFSRHGIPKEVISDNGPEFSSTSFSNFAKQWDFKHNPSSPRYPQSNGLIERTIQTVKKTLRKVVQSGDDVYLDLLALRTTPTKGNTKSPAYMLMNRNPRTLLPCLNFASVSKSQQLISPRKQSSYATRHYNEHSKDLAPLSLNDTIRIRQKGNWCLKGTVIDKCDQPRSYKVLTQNGTILRRNRRHLLKTNKPFQQELPIDYDDIIIDHDYDDQEQTTELVKSKEKPSSRKHQVQENKELIKDQYRTRSGRLVKPPQKLIYT